MRVDKVNQNKGIGYIKFNSNKEIDLVAESMDRLIAKQEKLVERAPDTVETEKLERYKNSKDAVAEIPKQNKMKLHNMRYTVTKEIRLRAMSDAVKNEKDEEKRKMIEMKVIKDKSLNIEDTPEFQRMNKVVRNAEDGSGLKEGTEVTRRNMQVLANALNDHIYQLEQSGLRTRRNREKYQKLQQLLISTQEQKAKFGRVRSKPTGWGRLRK